MIRNRAIYVYLILLATCIVSCQKEHDEQRIYDYLIDYSYRFTYTLNTIESVLTAQSALYPELLDIIDHVEYGVQVYKISYKTRYGDSVVTASGLACLPMASGSFPVISFQNGTNTAHDNAPSIALANPNYMLIEYMASNGYIILIPDYIGFGTSSEILHPYYDKTNTTNAVTDLIRAFHEISESGDIQSVSNDTLYLMGYSQGGWATLATLECLEQSDMNKAVAATSCGAGAYDLVSMSSHILNLETFPGPLYLPYFIYSQQTMGTIDQPLNAFFKEPYATTIPELFNGSYSNDEVNEALTETIADFVTDNMLTNFETASEFDDLREALTENSLSGWNTVNEISFYHGTSDVNVPPQQSQMVYDSFIHAGASTERIHYFEMNGLTHVTGLIPWGVQTINWFNYLENK